MMKVAKELPNSTTYNNLGSNAIYLITTLPEDERTKEHTTSQKYGTNNHEYRTSRSKKLARNNKNC